MQAKSLWYIGEKKMELRPIEVPAPGPSEVLARVEVCGVCTWDLFIYSGGFRGYKDFPFYFGHEGIGIVEAVGKDVTRFTPGDRVALRESAIIGAPGTGHMAEYALGQEHDIIALPSGVEKPELWMVEPVACCVNGVDLAEIKPGQKIGLVGCGFMGGILLQLLAASPASRVDVFDLRPESLDYARGITGSAPVRVFDLSADAAPLDSLAGTYDIVFETAAAEPAFRLANRLTRAGGTLAIFSWHHHPITFDFGDWHVRGLRVLNTSPAAAPDFSGCFARSVALMDAGIVDLSSLVTHVAAPEHASQLYEDGITKRNGYIKGVIRWTQAR